MTLCIAILGGACATAPTGKPDLLTFLADGTTRRDEVFLTLGTPNAQYESGRILAYRLGKDEGGYYPYEGHTWSATSFSLILVFDDQDVLARHAVVEVRRE